MMKRILVTIALLFLIVPQLFAGRGIMIDIISESGEKILTYEKSYALLIGVSDYTNGWPDLPGVSSDIAKVADILENTHGFEIRKVFNPNSSELKAAFNNFINEYGLNENNRLLIYFAGHGYTMEKAYGGDMGYIIPSDTPNPSRDKPGFIRKALDMQQIEVYAKRIEAKHAIFLFDSCFSGSIFNLSRSAPANINEKTKYPVRQFITSGDEDEEVPDDSIFRAQFVEALSGEGDLNGDGYVTGSELGMFLADNVANYSRGSQNPKYGKIRDQNLDKGDFVFPLPNIKPPDPVDGIDFGNLEVRDERRQWDKFLNKMKDEYNNIQNRHTDSAQSPELKQDLWKSFLNTYTQNYPYSEEDDDLRNQANSYLDELTENIRLSKERARAREWELMQQAFTAAEQLQASDSSLRKKKNAWDDFIETYTEDKPQVGSPDQLIYKAEQQYSIVYHQWKQRRPIRLGWTMFAFGLLSGSMAIGFNAWTVNLNKEANLIETSYDDYLYNKNKVRGPGATTIALYSLSATFITTSIAALIAGKKKVKRENISFNTGISPKGQYSLGLTIRF
jgi:hypothetical protein